jgi:hypothetical protein
MAVFRPIKTTAMEKINLPQSVTLLWALVIIMMTSQCSQQEVASPPRGHQNLVLSIPSGLYYQRLPGDTSALEFTVDSILSGLNILISDNKQNFGMLRSRAQTKQLGKGDGGYALAIPALYQVSDSNGTIHFAFGQGGAEDSSAAAVVKVIFGSFAETGEKKVKYDPVVIQVADTQILDYTYNSTPPVSLGAKQFLHISASNLNRAYISIENHPARGRVMVCILDALSGQFLSLLNPKTGSAQFFATKKSVYLIPVIVPEPSGNFGLAIDSIFFSVGDPVVNGSIRVSEE